MQNKNLKLKIALLATCLVSASLPVQFIITAVCYGILAAGSAVIYRKEQP